jgi:hypothetical protein
MPSLGEPTLKKKGVDKTKWIRFKWKHKIMRFMRTMKMTKNMRVLTKMEGAERYSANTQKLEGWWDKVVKEGKCQSDSLAYCKWLIGFKRALKGRGLDFSP